MNKTKIDWADMTWNIVTGCKYNCDYCYARRIAKRFQPTQFELRSLDDCRPIIPTSVNHLGCYECDEPVKLTNFQGDVLRTTPYPQGFKPTFHKYRLGELSRKTKGVNIFVCSMADLFGEWVPDEWIQQIFKACEKAPQHRYLFLTKNPKRYNKIPLIDAWFGATAVNQEQINNVFKNANPLVDFLSIEPIQSAIKLQKFFNSEIHEYRTRILKWVIVGAETGNRKDKILPKKEWILSIKEQCRNAGVPLFMKESLRELMGQDFVQEFPWKMRSSLLHVSE